MASKQLRLAFLRETNNLDTHPCLKDRLQAIDQLPAGVERGEFPSVPPPRPERTAATVLLGDHLSVAIRQLGEAWHQVVAPAWAARHSEACQLAADLAAFDRPDGPPPGPADLWARAQKLMTLHGDAEAIPVLDTLLTLEPQHGAANFIRGRHYLEQDDPRGVEHVERAMANAPSLTEQGCELLHAHFIRTGQRDRLRPLLERVDRFREASVLAQQERATVSAKDQFFPHDLSPEQIEHVRAVLAPEPEIAEAAVARKQVCIFPESPFYAVVLRIKVPWWKLRSQSANQRIVDRVVAGLQLPGHFLVFVHEHELKSTGKKIFALPQATVFSRPSR